MNCEHYEELASRYVDNELDGAGEAEVFGHLRDCESCRGFLRTALQARTSLLHDYPPPVPETLDRRMDRLVRERPHAVHAVRWRAFVAHRYLVPAPAAIAVVLFVLLSFGALFTMLRFRTAERPSSASNYVLLLPEVEVRGVYQSQSQNIR